MLKQPEPTLHKTTRPEITALFGEAKLVLDETPKAISPFGGLASFISFCGQIGFAREGQRQLPFAERRIDVQQCHPAGACAHRLSAVGRGQGATRRPLRMAARSSCLAHHPEVGALSQ